MARLIDLATLLADTLKSDGAPRRVRHDDLTVDTTGPGLPACVTVVSRGACRLRIDDAVGIAAAPGGGWLVRTAAHVGLVVWLPVLPRRVRFDAAGRVLELAPQTLDALELDAGGLGAVFADASGDTEIVAWGWRGDAAAASALERAPWYMLGSHTVVDGRAAVYRHVVGGCVFENRQSWPHGWRIVSENDAHALHLVLGGLFAAAPDGPLLLALRRQVVLATLERQDADGGYRHGEWTDRNESHYRLHCSAMHLMMDELAHADGPRDGRLAAALAAAAAYMARQAVPLSFGAWLLHDELEHSLELMRLGPFHWVRSRAFGKSESNMLVLNSHLDATIALDRYAQLTGDTQYAALVASARGSTAAVLSLRSAEPLYRLLFALIGLTFLPTARAAALPLWQRALKRLAWKFVIPRLPDIKARFPRLVMPGGYIDRELTLRTFAHDYHAVNLMDMARYLRRFPDEAPARRALLDGLAFARDSGLLERWREMPYQKYALGFWAEALYHVCTLFPDARYRAWLADAMQVLEDLQMGQPPSLLGANAEAVPPAQQLPCPSPVDARLRIANLGRRGAAELLVVNPASTALPLAWEVAPAEAVGFHSPDGRALAVAPVVVPARSWLWARAAD